MGQSWWDLINQDPIAAGSYGMGTQPQNWLSGLSYRPISFGDNMGQSDWNYFNDTKDGTEKPFGAAYGLLMNGYADMAGSNFYKWLQNRGQDQAFGIYNNLERSLKASGQGASMPNITDFFQREYFNPLEIFNRLSPQERGEDPRAYSPFTRFLTR